MLTVDSLKQYGADTEDGLKRCMNNEALYLRLVGMAIDDQGCEKLGEALAAGDLKAAFEAAHALKGVLGNLSLTPLYTPVSELTELLRHPAEGADYDALYGAVKEQREKLKALKG